MDKQRYWIAVVSKEHALHGMSGGFMQVCHGKEGPLKRMRQNDWLIVYSPKESMNGAIKCQAFTAIGQTTDENIYPFNMNQNFIPFRRNIKFYDCRETSILPLIDKLDFIKNKSRWGYAFRFGFLEIAEHDFNLITATMFAHEN